LLASVLDGLRAVKLETDFNEERLNVTMLNRAVIESAAFGYKLKYVYGFGNVDAILFGKAGLIIKF
jgi:hypothetical protein